MKKIITFFSICFALVGCDTLSYTRTSRAKEQKEREIAAVKAEYDKKLDEKAAEISQTKDAIISKHIEQKTTAANVFYAQDMLFKTIATPVRTDIIWHNYALEGWQALDNRMPDYDTMKKINERLKVELDETKTSLADLTNTHNQVMAENKALSDGAKALIDQLATLNKQIIVIQSEKAEALEEKRAELESLNQAIIDAQNAALDQKAEIAKGKRILSIGAGVVALLALAGAIYSPVMKDKLAIFSGICGMAAVGIWYIEPWHVGVAFGLSVATVIVIVLMKHRKEEKVSDSLVLGLQDIKDKDPELWKQIAPTIQDRLMVYKKKGNKIIAVKDQAIETYIDQKLADYDHLNVKVDKNTKNT